MTTDTSNTLDVHLAHTAIRALKRQEEELAYERKQLEQQVRDYMDANDLYVIEENGRTLFRLSIYETTVIDRKKLEHEWPAVFVSVASGRTDIRFTVGK